jgi:hypothetical protein
LIDCISVGVDHAAELRTNREQVEAWQRSELTDVTAKVVIYKAFVEGTGSPETPYPHRPRPVLRSEVRGVPVEDHLESANAFTSAFKELDPIPQFRATAKLGEFLEARFSQAF